MQRINLITHDKIGHGTGGHVLPGRPALTGLTGLTALAALRTAPQRLRGRPPRLPRSLRWASRIDAWPPALWLGLQALALWPVLVIALRRLADGRDDPMSLLALTLLPMAAAGGRLPCHWAARPRWLAAAALLTVIATHGGLPWPAVATIAALALVCSWAAFRPPGTPLLPVLGLSWLSLPMLAADATGSGMPLTWLAWLSCCCACACALWNQLPDRRFLARLPAVGLAVAVGHGLGFALRVAIALSAQLQRSEAARATLDDAIGLLVLVAVGGLVLRLMRRETPHAPD